MGDPSVYQATEKSRLLACRGSPSSVRSLLRPLVLNSLQHSSRTLYGGVRVAHFSHQCVLSFIHTLFRSVCWLQFESVVVTGSGLFPTFCLQLERCCRRFGASCFRSGHVQDGPLSTLALRSGHVCTSAVELTIFD